MSLPRPPPWMHRLRLPPGRPALAPLLAAALAFALAAAAAGLSVSRALHLLKEETGMSFTEHLRRARVEFAKYMLLDSDHSIAEIALEAGFADQSHFTRQFREVEQTTPRRFRAENR